MPNNISIDLDPTKITKKKLTNARILEEIIAAELGDEVLHFKTVLQLLIVKIQPLLGSWVAKLFRDFCLKFLHKFGKHKGDTFRDPHLGLISLAFSQIAIYRSELAGQLSAFDSKVSSSHSID